MADINITVGEFTCTSPTVGTTYRQLSSGNYLFNYDWLGDLYETYGMNATVQLFYSGDGSPYQEYTLSSLPNNANNLSLGPFNYDSADFRLVFSVDDGTVCEYTFDIPYSSITIL